MHSDANNAIKGDSAADRKKACLPVLIEAPVKHEMAIVKERIIFLKQNIMKDLFLGHAFTYPFTVCICYAVLFKKTSLTFTRDLPNY